jgi:hypothetical protein
VALAHDASPFMGSVSGATRTVVNLHQMSKCR